MLENTIEKIPLYKTGCLDIQAALIIYFNASIDACGPIRTIK